VEKRCDYCRKYCKKLDESNKCTPCDKELKSVAAKIAGRYSVALKKLAER